MHDTNLRIGVITPHPPSTGTLNEYGLHLVRSLALKEEVDEVVVFGDTLPDGEHYPDLPHTRFVDCWRFNSLRSAWRIRRAVVREDVDVAIFNVQFATFGDRRVAAALGLLAPLLVRGTGTRSVVLLHNIMETIDLEGAGFGTSRLVERIIRLAGTIVTWLVLKADLVAVTMPQYVTVLREKYGADNVAVIPHGTFDVPLESDTSVPPGPAQLMAFGKFGTYKQVEPLLDAARILSAKHAVEVVVAGTDSPNAPGYLERVRDAYAGDPVRFTGYVAEEDVPDVFRDATVAVFPYVATTGSSGVVHQAASYSRALVMPDIGDFRRLVEAEGYVAEWFDPADPESLAAAIDRLLSDDTRRVAQGLRNHAVAAGLPMEDVADWYLEHIDFLLTV